MLPARAVEATEARRGRPLQKHGEHAREDQPRAGPGKRLGLLSCVPYTRA